MARESVIGEIPKSWEITVLGEACRRGGGDIQTGPFGSQLHAADYVAVGIPSIMPQNIGNNRILPEGIARITEKDAERLSRYRVRKGDVIYSRRGDVERRSLIREEEDGWLCGTGCLRVRFGEGVVNPDFASYYLGHPDVRDWIVSHAVGSTMPNLNTSILSALPIVLPPLDEQRAIARILGALDDKIELNRQMNHTLEAMAQSLFKSWFVDFDPVTAKAAGRAPFAMTAETAALFPSRFVESELGLIPEGWRVGKLSDLADVNARAIKSDFPFDLIQYIDISSVSCGYLDRASQIKIEEAPSRAQRLVKHGDTIWSCVRPNRKSYLLIQDPEPNVVVSTGFAVLSPKTETSCYLYLWATTDEFVDYLTAHAEGSAYPAVRPDAFTSATMLIPSSQIITAFQGKAATMFEMCDSNNKQSHALAALRDLLLPKLLSGEIPIGQAEKLVAEAV